AGGPSRFRGVVYLVPSALLAWGGLAGFAKFGGYVNNFLPLFLGATILLGLAVGHALRSRRRWTGLVGPAVALLLVLQCLQPWNRGTEQAGGLWYRPSAQLPPPEAGRAWTAMMDWLAGRRRAGESVWIPHHQ